jgi:hypothetical protein
MPNHNNGLERYYSLVLMIFLKAIRTIITFMDISYASIIKMTILMVKANLSFPQLKVVVISTILLAYIFIYIATRPPVGK